MPFARKGRGLGWKRSKKRGTWRRKRYHGVSYERVRNAMRRINSRLQTRRGQRFHRKAGRRKWAGGSRKYPRTMGARLNRPFKSHVAPLTLAQYPTYLPRVTRWTGVFTDRINQLVTLRHFAARVYRLNSPFDPRWQTGANQQSVMGWALMSDLYKQYRVYRTDVQACWSDLYDGSNDNKDAWIQGQCMMMLLGNPNAAGSVGLSEALDYGELDGTVLSMSDDATMATHLQRLREGGAYFPGYQRFKRLCRPIVGAVGTSMHAIGFPDRRFYTRLAMTVPIWKLAGAESSWTQFKANQDWTGADMENNPLNQRYIQIGWRNVHNAATLGHHCAGELDIKLKMHMLLMNPVRIRERTVTTAVEPTPAAPPEVGNVAPY